MSSRPHTPHRLSESRRKLHRSSGLHLILPPSPNVHYSLDDDTPPLETDRNMERLASLADAFEQLKLHISDLSSIHFAINNKFNEPFAAFLYGLFITMFCNNFPGCPTYEQFESILKAHEAQTRIKELRSKINDAKLENQKLKQELALARPSRVHPPPRSELFRSAQLLTRKRPPPKPMGARSAMFPSPSKKKVAVAQDETTTTSDSFVTTPGSGGGRGESSGARNKASAFGPNLDQPPRYMRGLFDKTSAANAKRASQRDTEKRSQRAREIKDRRTNQQNRLRERPPFR